MNADQILSEIREANLSYLMLAQSLIRADREQALYRLGISEESAALIALLSPAKPSLRRDGGPGSNLRAWFATASRSTPSPGRLTSTSWSEATSRPPETSSGSTCRPSPTTTTST